MESSESWEQAKGLPSRRDLVQPELPQQSARELRKIDHSSLLLLVPPGRSETAREPGNEVQRGQLSGHREGQGIHGGAGGCSVTKLCPTLCHPIDCSTPGFPVIHYLLELAHAHVLRVGDAIQPSCPLSSSSPPAFSLFQHRGLFQ